MPILTWLKVIRSDNQLMTYEIYKQTRTRTKFAKSAS